MTKSACFAAAFAVAAAVSCGDDPADPGPELGTGSTVSVVNATLARIDVLIDGVNVTSGLNVAGATTIDVAPGSHTVRVQFPGSNSTDLTINPADGSGVVAIVRSTVEGDLVANVLADTAATPAPGKTKLRVIHLAGSAPPVDIWRTQPDFPTPTRVMFPFPYLAESAYIQSDAGTWTVYVTPTTDWNNKLAESGPIAAASGEVKTVVLLDSAGFLKVRTVTDR